jgi:hypothetical protein
MFPSEVHEQPLAGRLPVHAAAVAGDATEIDHEHLAKRPSATDDWVAI